VRFTDGSWARTAAILARINAESESVVGFLFIVYVFAQKTLPPPPHPFEVKEF
jgi:hypothetical protein